MVGPAPSFSDVHLKRMLFECSRGPVGRKRLVQILGLGEGSVRTVIKRLTEDGLLSSSKAGHTLTSKGKKTVSDLLKLHSIPVEVDLEKTLGGMSSYVVVFGRAGSVSSTASLRDEALRAGADGALILVKSDRLRFPNDDIQVGDFPDLGEKLSGITLLRGDVLVIGFGASKALAEDGALSVVQRLLS